MGRVDSAIAGVQERDKWRKRLEALEKALDELVDRRHRLEQRLRRVRQELVGLQRISREFVEVHGRFAGSEVTYGPTGPILR